MGIGDGEMEDKQRGGEDNGKAIEEEEEEKTTGGDGKVSNQAVVVLPYELLMVEVLARLPAKSLMRFKCLSNLWCSTISQDHSFANAHRARHSPSSRAGLFVTFPDADDSLRCFYTALPGGEDSISVPHQFTTTDCSSKYNGATEVVKNLICLYAGNRSWICNVSTREIRELPSSSDLENAVLFTYFLGFVSSRKEYKLYKVCLVPRFSTSGVIRYYLRNCELLTLGKDASWRRPWSLCNSPKIDLQSGRPSVYIDGSLCYWKSICNLIVFNFEDESFQEIDRPPKASGSIYDERGSLLLQFGGHFALVRVPDRLVNQRLELWKLAWRNGHEQGSCEWINHVIDVPHDFPVGGFSFLGNLALPAGDQMLLAGLLDVSNNMSAVPVYSYDHAKGKFEKFVITKLPWWPPSSQVASICRGHLNKFRVYYFEEDITPLHDLVISNKDSSLTAASCDEEKKKKKKKKKEEEKEKEQ
ncbi:hypothetical protein Vadar_026503 [Vaccinium darrowii]|uniref:Uncharacterized protein n=1 Tax=Vaccinium darrowii TaxID=229202 RepID=A0ACB7Y1W0_9ERIC|nr:hypothetical protein Vadar_026503 [Vaccinium darrowii]